MSAVFFFIAAAFVFAGAIGVVVLSNPFYNVLALVTHLFGLAGMFLLLAAMGRVVLARRRAGSGTIDGCRPMTSFAGVLRPLRTGTMAEAASGRVFTPANEAESELTAGEPARVETGW